MREREYAELVLGRRQFGLVDLPLRLEEVRQVRVAVDRDAVGAGGDHLVERGRESAHRLLGKPVDQVHVDRHEPVAARRVHQRAGLGLALDAVDRGCTAGSKSWMPSEMRLKPSEAS